MAKVKLGIVGLGLIGSSILSGLVDNPDYEIFCVSKSSYLEALKFTKNSSCDLKTLKPCDIVFVCSEVSKTLFYLNELNSILSEKTVVADVCSIKKELLNKKFNFDFILSHPMAGSDKSGFSSMDKNLFKNAKWLVEKENNLLNKVISDLGAKKVLIDMKFHDNLICEISHFPTILSYLLFESVSENALSLASSGFRDMTRLSMTTEDLSLNMFNLNLENIEKMYKTLGSNLEKIKSMTDVEKKELFNKISKKRKEMYDENGKNIL